MKRLLRVMGIPELTAAEKRRTAAAEATQTPVLGRLALHIETCWQDAVRFKDERITPRLKKCQRAVAGKYEDDVLAEIRKQGHSTELYFNVTRTKSSAAEAMLLDVLQTDLWSLKPTPISSLPDSATEIILQQAIEGLLADPRMAITVQVVQEHVNRFYDKYLEAFKKEHLEALEAEALKRTEQMKLKIRDQFAEGGFMQAFADFLQELTVYLLAIIKGPVIRMQPRIVYRGGQVLVEDVPIPTWSAVSSHDFFPAPNSRSIQDHYICERVHFDPAALARMKGVAGWDSAIIDEVLAGFQHLKAPDIESGESERAALENRASASGTNDSSTTVTGVEFWGSVQGVLLAEWGMKIPEDKLMDFFEITAVKIGSHVVRAIKNPHPTGQRPYFATSFEKAPGSIWGVGLPEKMSDCQDMSNAILRAMADNIALASGFQTSVDMDAIEPAVDVLSQFPGKIWQWRSSESHGGRDPVTHWQPQLLTTPLIEAAEYFLKMADDRTLIPRFAHGDDTVGGAGDTARGLEMLMDAGSLGLKRVVGFIDLDIIQPLVTQIYTWNLMYGDDDSIKADAQVVPGGVLAELAEQEAQARQLNLLASTLNPMDEQIFGVPQRAEIYRGVLRKLKIDPDMLPSEEELEERERLALDVGAEGEEALV